MAQTKVTDTLRKQVEALNRHDVQAFVSLYDPEAVVVDPMYPEPLRGADAIATDIADFLTAFPDLEMRLVRDLVDGNTHAYEITITGTHTGPLAGPGGDIPATSKRFEIGGAGFVRVDDSGRVVEERRYYDLAGLIGQLGLTS